VAYASSFDTIGPFATGLGDLAAVFGVLAGRDEKDNTSADVEVPDYSQALDSGVQGLRIGLPREYFGEGLDPETGARVREGVARLEEAGATVKEVSLPHTSYGIATYYILTTAEASSNLARFDGVRYGHRTAEKVPTGQNALQHLYTRSRSEGFGDEVKTRIMLGTYVLSSGYYDAYYAKAQRVRTLIRQDFDRVFEEVDMIAGPATPGPAFPAGSRTEDPLAMYLSDIYTVTANLAGIPGLVVPAGATASGLPVGLQLLGPSFSEKELLRAGRVAWDPLTHAI
jgi:aspartyl-tRNA(Asn)/glutamyl-tRNA(Gln) amidotransferase subunit A